MTAHIAKRIFLKADADRVWDFLTRPDRLGEWFHPTDRALDTPGAYKMAQSVSEPETVCYGEVIEVEPKTRLVYTFTHKWLEGHKTRVAWTLTPVEGGVMLDLLHDGFDGAPVDVFDSLSGHDAGWDEHFVKLRARAAAMAAA